jgi:hypothetical protein
MSKKERTERKKQLAFPVSIMRRFFALRHEAPMTTTLPEPNEITLKNWSDVIDEELPSFGNVTEATRETTRKFSSHARGSMRISTGLFFTTEEYERKKKEELALPMP